MRGAHPPHTHAERSQMRGSAIVGLPLETDSTEASRDGTRAQIPLPKTWRGCR